MIAKVINAGLMLNQCFPLPLITQVEKEALIFFSKHIRSVLKVFHF